MLRLQDFFHLAQLDPWIEQLIAGGPGLIVVAGLDVHAPDAAAGGRFWPGDRFRPSGRGTIFRALLYEMLERRRSVKSIVVTPDRGALRVPRRFSRQVRFWLVQPPYSYAGRIAAAALQKPDLLVIDRLEVDAIPAALEAAQNGLCVLTQIDTVFYGADLAHRAWFNAGSLSGRS